MALGREVNDSVGLVAVDEVLNGGGVADVDALKAVVGGLVDVREVFKVAGIRQRVNVDDGGLGVALYKRRTTCEPMNPAPPVMRTVGIRER